MKSWTVLDRAFIRIYSMACLGLLWRWSEVSRNWIKSSLHYYKCPRRVQIAQSTSDSRSALLSTTTIGHDNDGLHNNPYVSHWDPFTILSWIRRQKSIKWSNENRFSGPVALCVIKTKFAEDSSEQQRWTKLDQQLCFPVMHLQRLGPGCVD